MLNWKAGVDPAAAIAVPMCIGSKSGRMLLQILRVGENNLMNGTSPIFFRICASPGTGAHQGSEQGSQSLLKHFKKNTAMKTPVHSLLRQANRLIGTSLLAFALLSGAASGQIGGVKVSTQTLLTQDHINAINNAAAAPTFSPAERSSRPTLFVLISGGTSAPGNGIPLVEPLDTNKRPGTIGYSRFYFDFPFVQGILGATSSLYTMGGTSLNSTSWKTTALENTVGNQFAFRNNPLTTTAAARATTPAVGLVRLNGSTSIGEMARNALREIRTLVDTFERYTGRRPFVILAGHSKGGLVTRYIMSNAESRPGGVAGVNLTADERAAIVRLRNQTRCCVTIASPHTGSPLPDHAIELREGAAAGIQNLVQTAWSALRIAALSRGINLPVASPINVTSNVIGIMGNPDDLGHLTTQFWNTMNNDVNALHPARMVRSDGSRIPFFLYGGRTPGAGFYATASFTGAGGPAPAALLPGHDQFHINHMTNALIGLDYALHNAVGGDWGRIRTAGAASKNLDIVRRAWPVYGLPLRMSNPGERLPIIGLEGAPTYFLQGASDNETDSDGMVSMDSAMGVGLFTGPITIENMQLRAIPVPATMMEPWERNVMTPVAGQPTALGSWYRMYSGAWNMQNHSTIIKRRELGNELNRLLISAGPLASATSGTISIWPAR